MQNLKRTLPPEVGATLAPHQSRALDHPIRRQILRALSRDTASLGLEDLAEEIPAASVSSIGYHLLVLEECGLVSVSGALSPPSEAERGFASNIADNQAVADALGAMLAVDRLDG